MDKWLTAESIVPEVEQAVSHRHILGSGWGKVIWKKKNQAQKANRKLCTAWIISPNSLSSMSRRQFISVLRNSGLKKGCLKYNFLFGADSYKDSVNVPLCVKLLSSGCQSRKMSQPVADVAGTWLHRHNNFICKVTGTLRCSTHPGNGTEVVGFVCY